MKAIILGSTGLVGRHITEALLAKSEITEILVLTRRPYPVSHPKIISQIVDFERSHEWLKEVKGDVLFSALGTTIRDAGSKRGQYKVDHDYQYDVARAAAENGVKTYVLISSVNADSRSPFFYLRMKGELEEHISKLPYTSINILRPGPLKGHREKKRLNEIIANKVLESLPGFLVTPGLHPVDAGNVALVAITAGLMASAGVHIIGPRQILSGIV